MSIKIYNGLISSKDLNVFQLGREIREVLEPVYYKKINALIDQLDQWESEGRSEEDIYKELWLMPSLHPSKSWTTDSWAVDIVDNLKRSMTRTLSDADFGYTVSLIPNALVAEKTLVLIFTEDKDYREALLESGVVEDYHYQNQTSCPEEIPEEDWNDRKTAWGWLIEHDYTPSQVGLELNNPSKFDVFVQRSYREDE